MLAMKDRDGIVEASVPGLAKRAGVSRKQCEESLALFLAPDPDSRTKDKEGRRIEVVDGGWFVINHDKYRHKDSVEERRKLDAARQRRKRERDVSRDTALHTVTSRDGHVTVTDVTKCHAIADTDPDTDPEKIKSVDQEQSTFVDDSPSAHSVEKTKKRKSVHRVLVKLAHQALTEHPDDAKNALKDLAAKAQIFYDAETITKALDSAEKQRERRT